MRWRVDLTSNAKILSRQDCHSPPAEIFNFQNNRRLESNPLNRSRSRRRSPPVTPPTAPARSYRSGLTALIVLVALGLGLGSLGRMVPTAGRAQQRRRCVARGAAVRRRSRPAESRRGDPRHDPSGPPRCVRLSPGGNPQRRRPGAGRRAVRAREHRGPHHAAGALVAVHGSVSTATRRARQRWVFPERQRADAGRDPQGARIRDGRIHRGVRARFEVGHQSGIRYVL